MTASGITETKVEWPKLGRVAAPQVDVSRTADIGTCRRSRTSRRTAYVVKGFGRLRTKASSAGTRGPRAQVYG